MSLLLALSLAVPAIASEAPSFLVGAWMGYMDVQGSVPAGYQGKWQMLSTYQKDGSIMNLVQRKGEEEQIITGGTIVKVDYTDDGQGAAVYQKQQSPTGEGTVDVCETYRFIVSNGRPHAKLYGAYSTECPIGKANADWVGEISKIDLSSPKDFLQIVSSEV